MQPGQLVVCVRPATLDDDQWLVEGNAAMALETESLRLDRARLAEGVRAVLSDPIKGRYLLATAGSQILGQLLVTFEWSDWRNGTFWWVQSVYVRPDFRRRGVFRALYQFLETQARADATVCGIRLYVERHNRTAQQVYSTLGMSETDYQLWEVDFRLRRSVPLEQP